MKNGCKDCSECFVCDDTYLVLWHRKPDYPDDFKCQRDGGYWPYNGHLCDFFSYKY